MKQVLQYNEGYTRIGFICGVLGGFGKYLLQVHTTGWINVLQACFTALICGAAGVAGKEGYLYVKRQIKKYRSKKEDEKTV